MSRRRVVNIGEGGSDERRDAFPVKNVENPGDLERSEVYRKKLEELTPQQLRDLLDIGDISAFAGALAEVPGYDAIVVDVKKLPTIKGFVTKAVNAGKPSNEILKIIGNVVKFRRDASTEAVEDFRRFFWKDLADKAAAPKAEEDKFSDFVKKGQSAPEAGSGKSDNEGNSEEKPKGSEKANDASEELVESGVSGDKPAETVGSEVINPGKGTEEMPESEGEVFDIAEATKMMYESFDGVPAGIWSMKSNVIMKDNPEASRRLLKFLENIKNDKSLEGSFIEHLTSKYKMPATPADLNKLRKHMEANLPKAIDGGEGLLVGAEGGQADAEGRQESSSERAETGSDDGPEGKVVFTSPIGKLKNKAYHELNRIKGVASEEVMSSFERLTADFEYVLDLQKAESYLIRSGLVDEGAAIPSAFSSGDNREFYSMIITSLGEGDVPEDSDLMDVVNELESNISALVSEYLRAQKEVFEKVKDLIENNQSPYSAGDLEKIRTAYYVVDQNLSSEDLASEYKSVFENALKSSFEKDDQEAELGELEVVQEKLAGILGKIDGHIGYEVGVTKRGEKLDGESVLRQFRIIEKVLSEYYNYLKTKVEKGEDVAAQILAFDEFLADFGGVHLNRMKEMAVAQASHLNELDKKIVSEAGKAADRSTVLEVVSGNFSEFKDIILAGYLQSEMNRIQRDLDAALVADVKSAKGGNAREARHEANRRFRELWKRVRSAAADGDVQALREVRAEVENFPYASVEGLSSLRESMEVEDVLEEVDDVIEQFEEIAARVEAKLSHLAALNETEVYENLHIDLLTFEQMIEDLDDLEDENERRAQILAIVQMARNLIKRSKISYPKNDERPVKLDEIENDAARKYESGVKYNEGLTEEQIIDFESLFRKIDSKIYGREKTVNSKSKKIGEEERSLASQSIEVLRRVREQLVQAAGEGYYSEDLITSFERALSMPNRVLLSYLEDVIGDQHDAHVKAREEYLKADKPGKRHDAHERSYKKYLKTAYKYDAHVNAKDELEKSDEDKSKELAEAEKFADRIVAAISERRDYMSDEESAAFVEVGKKLRELEDAKDPEKAYALLVGLKAELKNIAKDKGGLNWTPLVAVARRGGIDKLLERLIPEPGENGENKERFNDMIKHFKLTLDSMPRGADLKADEIDSLISALSELKANFEQDITDFGRDLTDEENEKRAVLLTAFDQLEAEYKNFKEADRENARSEFAGKIEEYKEELNAMPNVLAAANLDIGDLVEALEDLEERVSADLAAAEAILSENDKAEVADLLKRINELKAGYGAAGADNGAAGVAGGPEVQKPKKSGTLLDSFKAYFTGKEAITEDMEFTKGQTGVKVVANIAYSLSNVFGLRAAGEGIRKIIQDIGYKSEREAIVGASSEAVNKLFEQLKNESADVEAERQSAIQKLVARIESSEYLTKEEKDQYKKRVELIVKTTDAKMEEARGVLKSHLDQVAQDYLQSRLTWAHVGMDAMAAAGSAIGVWGVGEALTGSSEAGRALARAAFGTASIGRVGLNEGYRIQKEDRAAVLASLEGGEAKKMSSPVGRFMRGLARPWQDLFTPGKRARGAGGVMSELMGLFGLGYAAAEFSTPGSIDGLMSGDSGDGGLSKKDLEELYPGESLRGDGGPSLGTSPVENGPAPTKADAQSCLDLLDKCCKNDNGSSMVDIGSSSGIEWSKADISNFAVRPGDGVTTVLYRQIEANPAKFGFDPSTDGNLENWSRRLATKIAKDNGVFFEGGYTGVKGSAIGKLSLMLEKKPDGSWGFDEYDAVTGKKMADSEISKYLYDYYPPEEVDVVPSGNSAERVQGAKVGDLSDEIDAIPSPKVPDSSVATEAVDSGAPASSDNSELEAERAALQKAEKLAGVSRNIDKLAEDGKLSIEFMDIKGGQADWANVDVVPGGRMDIRPILREMRPSGKGSNLHKVAQTVKEGVRISLRKAKKAVAAWALIYEEINGVKDDDLNAVINSSSIAKQLKDAYIPNNLELSKIQNAFKTVAGVNGG